MAFNENLFVDSPSELLDRRLLFFHLLTSSSPFGPVFSEFYTFPLLTLANLICLRRQIQQLPIPLHTKTGKMDFAVDRELCKRQVPLLLDYH